VRTPPIHHRHEIAAAVNTFSAPKTRAIAPRPVKLSIPAAFKATCRLPDRDRTSRSTRSRAKIVIGREFRHIVMGATSASPRSGGSKANLTVTISASRKSASQSAVSRRTVVTTAHQRRGFRRRQKFALGERRGLAAAARRRINGLGIGSADLIRHPAGVKARRRTIQADIDVM